MAEDTIFLKDSGIDVVREISARRNVTNEELAEKGLAISNHLDSGHVSISDWEVDEGGFRSRQYSVLPGQWPVYLVKDEEMLKKRILENKPDGAVVYKATLDLEKCTLGANVPFEYMYSSPGSNTLLNLKTEGDKMILVSATRPSRLELSLAERFDNNGRLTTYSGEFFIDGYSGYGDLKDERIYRFLDGKPVEITSEIKSLREDMEHRSEIYNDLNIS